MTTNLLLNRPLLRSSIEVGRLVMNPLYPDCEFFQPTTPAFSTKEDGLNDTDSAIGLNADVVVDNFEDVRDVLECTRGINVDTSFFDILSFAWKNTYQISSTITSAHGTIRYLRDADSYFDAACQNVAVQAWIENHAQRSCWMGKAASIYLICGFKTLVDARVEQSVERSKERDNSVKIPTASLAMAACGMPPLVTGFELSAGMGTQQRKKNEAAYTVKGEMVYAVQYRKIRLSRYKEAVSNKNGRKMSSPLEAKTCWKSYINDRGEEEEEEQGEEQENFVQVEVAESPTADDLEEFGTFSTLNVGGERILYRVGDDEDEDEDDDDDEDEEEDDDDISIEIGVYG